MMKKSSENSRKDLETDKTRKNAFSTVTCGRLMNRKFLVSSRTIDG